MTCEFLLTCVVCICGTGTPAEMSHHCFELARLVYVQLSSWRHSNGQILAEMYHSKTGFLSSESQGPIVNFNLLRADGSYIGYSQVFQVVPFFLLT